LSFFFSQIAWKMLSKLKFYGNSKFSKKIWAFSGFSKSISLISNLDSSF